MNDGYSEFAAAFTHNWIHKFVVDYAWFCKAGIYMKTLLASKSSFLILILIGGLFGFPLRKMSVLSDEVILLILNHDHRFAPSKRHDNDNLKEIP